MVNLEPTSVLKLLGPVVGAVFALHAEVDVGANAAIVERLDRTNIVAHTQEDLRWLVLAQQPQRVHLMKTEREKRQAQVGMALFQGRIINKS